VTPDTQRIAAYAVIRDEERFLLVRAGAASTVPGTWFLPGGGVEHGEHPEDALVREVEEETGYCCVPMGLMDVHSSSTELREHGTLLHTVGLVYRAEIRGGALRNEVAGSSDAASWLELDEALALPLAPFVADALAGAER
jgi:8-oxo-dGTP diphosphatase